MKSCPEPNELAALFDFELTETRASDLRDHTATCVRCRGALDDFAQLERDLRSAAPGALGGSAEAFADDIVARLSSRRAETKRAPRTRIFRFAAFVAAAAVPLAVGLAYRIAKPADDGAWNARGSTAPDDARRTLVRFGRIANDAFEPILDDARLRPDDVLCGEVGGTRGSTRYLLAFLVDAAGERHWIYPAYELGAPEPTAMALPATAAPRVLGSMVRIAGPTAGPARLVAIVLPHAESVAYVERAASSALTREQLAAHYPDALIAITRVFVEVP